MRRFIIPLLVIAGIFVWLVVRGARSDETYYTGTIEARDVRLGSLVGGRISEVNVQEGDSVQAGQVVVRFEPNLLEPQVREQEARVAQARAALDRVVTGPRGESIERARIEWDRAEKERRRQESLRDQSLTSDEAYEAAAAIAESARQSYEELKRGSRSEDEREAVAALAATEERLAYLRRQLDELVVRAPLAGVIQTLDLRPGDIVPANQPVAAMILRGDLWVHVYVPETRLGAVRVGQSARLSVDTYPERSFGARVISVRDRAEYTPRNVQTAEQREDRVFAVKLAVEAAPELKPGMTATVRFE
jgi:multidrug resistance efflux pump